MVYRIVEMQRKLDEIVKYVPAFSEYLFIQNRGNAKKLDEIVENVPAFSEYLFIQNHGNTKEAG